MADGVQITAGAGTTVAADDISSVFYQRVKQALGPDGTWTADQSGRAIGTDGAAYVDPRPYVVTGASNSSGLTIATTAYSIGDTLGAGWSLASAARVSGSGGIVTAAVLLDKGDVMTSATLYFSTGSITFGTDNAAPSVSDTDAEKLCARLALGFDDLGGCRAAFADSLAIPYGCDATTLYVYAVTGTANAIFTAVTDLRLRLTVIPD